MPIWILTRKPGSERPWEGYTRFQRIAVVAPSDPEARDIAAKALSARHRQKDSGQQALGEHNTPWHNQSACICREITDESGACVLAIQGDQVDIANPEVMCREHSKTS